ncbi:hypothetical protein P5673_002125 [Acropora cervicornis]|uniref:Uncharacterized protein n=1 Tax=Acropora cervicornis TaxID=6130 RepID=A0AAD9R4U1_ACRCE|nr:hypothetical protein P5673_002125 [Acropora cervicornis]
MQFKNTTQTNGTHKIIVISGCLTGCAVSYRTSHEDRIGYLMNPMIFKYSLKMAANHNNLTRNPDVGRTSSLQLYGTSNTLVTKNMATAYAFVKSHSKLILTIFISNHQNKAEL